MKSYFFETNGRKSGYKAKKVIFGRMEGLKHEEIAQRLNISVHTVQNHISTALRKLKTELKDYLPLFIFFFGSW